MYDFLNAIGGMGFAILGAALTVGLCCVGSAKGTGLVGEAAASVGIVAKHPEAATKGLIFCGIVEFYAILSLVATIMLATNIL